MHDSPSPTGRGDLRRRRLLLYAGALALLAIVAAVAVAGLTRGGDRKSHATARPPLIVERFALKPVSGQSGRGLAELVRHAKGEGLRALAVGLRPTLGGEAYQLLLTGNGRKPKLLGSEAVDRKRTFVGEAKVSADEVHAYAYIELRRVTAGTNSSGTLVLRGGIPR